MFEVTGAEVVFLRFHNLAIYQIAACAHSTCATATFVCGMVTHPVLLGPESWTWGFAKMPRTLSVPSGASLPIRNPTPKILPSVATLRAAIQAGLSVRRNRAAASSTTAGLCLSAWPDLLARSLIVSPHTQYTGGPLFGEYLVSQSMLVVDAARVGSSKVSDFFASLRACLAKTTSQLSTSARPHFWPMAPPYLP